MGLLLTLTFYLISDSVLHGRHHARRRHPTRHNRNISKNAVFVIDNIRSRSVYILLYIKKENNLSIKYALLGILAEQDLHGYELKTSFDDKVGEFWSLNFGQIYSTLDRLEKEELVTHDRETQERRPDRKIFRITPQGRESLAEWLTAPVGKVRALRDEFFIKLVFMDKSDSAPILALIEKQKALYIKRMSQLTQRKLAVKKGVRDMHALTTELLIDAGLFHAESDIRWLDLCASKIKAASGREADEGGKGR